MYCPKCGKQFDDGARFCKYCGTPAPEYSAAPGDRAVPKYGATPSVSKPETLPKPSDAYHKLGGGLAVISYGRLISSILELVVCLVATVSTACFKYAVLSGSKQFIGLYYFNKFGIQIHCYLFSPLGRQIDLLHALVLGVTSYGSLLVAILYVFHLCGSIVLYRKIKARKMKGIGFYRVISVIISCIAIGIFAAECFLMYDPLMKGIAVVEAQIRIAPIAAATIWLILDALISSLVFSIYFKTSERAKIYFGTKQ